ncbi:TBC1 domain family member 7 [Galendromus occidentalis]|uniref:TBC1 domain family member 7 n=1 Tax=Galendromus occidentalis TaxID=34638 RepID=A0AAJ6VYF3_9ACAR|nr:TBC1 domain family member 7 [Galendromus occidentalis]
MAGSESAGNFRSSYYDKAGIRNVNETKALDQALSRNPVDIGKLCCLLQRITVPASHRERLWKLVLGITPADSRIAKSIEEDRRGQFEMLKSTLEVMRLIDAKSSPVETVTLMILLERGELQMNHKSQLDSAIVRDLQQVFGVMCHVASKLQDAYWLARNFHNHMVELRFDTNDLISQTRSLLEKDDPTLLECLVRGSQDGTISIQHWFNLYFASVLPESALLKVWDKILGGCVGKLGCKHLTTTAKIILIQLRPAIVEAKSNEQITQILHQPLPEELATPLLNTLKGAN